MAGQNSDGRDPNRSKSVCSTSGKSYTYAQLRKLSGKFASSLIKCKLYPGSTVAMIVPNIPESAIVVLGASEAGIKITMSNPISTAKEISRQLENSGASAVITTAEQYPVVKESISGNPNIKLPIIFIDETKHSSPDGTIRFSELIADSVPAFNESSSPGRSSEDTMFLPYSSGTTGLPKGVELSHRNIVVNCRQIQDEIAHPGYETTETHQNVVPVILPVFHISGLTVVLLNHLSVGAELVFLRKFNTKGALKCFKDYKSNILYAVPPKMLFLGNSKLVTRAHLQGIRFIMSGATPVDSKTVNRVITMAKHEITVAQGSYFHKSKRLPSATRGLEELLRANEGILDAAVIAEPHPSYGEVPKAFVVRGPGALLDENAVKNYIAERVPKYKQLGSVQFIDVIPKSAVDMILYL